MNIEQRIVDYVVETRDDDVPAGAIDTVKKMILADIGTTVAGARSAGCEALVDFYRNHGGKPEATILIHGEKIPAENAAFVNSVMSRALDFCDAIAPGPHIGSSVIPTALACAELIGGCSGKDLITALAVGAEIAARLNLTESAYDGFDPTGICVTFGSTAVASKLLRLDHKQTWNALGLAFNRCGGSFQSHIDGSLGVRVNQGWVSHAGLSSARFSQLGITGPKNFLTGIYGYYHLYGKNTLSPETAVVALGDEYRLRDVVFKKFPSCAMTAGSTDAIIDLVARHNLDPKEIRSVTVNVPPYAYKLVGHAFSIGDNPTVNAQFSIQYCVANAILRKASKIQHFSEGSVSDPDIIEFIPRIHISPDEELNRRGHTALDMCVLMSDGLEFVKKVDIAPGFPGNPLTDQDHLHRFWDCMDFGRFDKGNNEAEKLFLTLSTLEDSSDVVSVVNELTPK